MGAIHNRHVLDDILRALRIQVATSDESLQEDMLDAIWRQAHLASAEELLARRRVEALAYGETHVDPSMIVEIIRVDRESH